MEKDKMLIDQRFRVDAATNMVTDLSNQTATKLEPRLMTLLCMLAANPRELVSREVIIREIWNDYGGADDALHQAISFLRKALDDTGKTRIRTIPKKGYMLDAAVAPPEAPLIPQNVSPAGRKNYKPVYAWAVLILIAVVVILGRNIFFSSEPKSREPGGAPEDTTYQYKEMREHLQRTQAQDSLYK